MTHVSAVVCLAYGLVLASWAAFARFAAPAVIRAGYEGRSVSFLNRLLQGKRHPPAHYLDLWSSFSVAVGLGIVVHLVLVLLILLRPGAIGGKGRLGLVLFATGFLILTVLSGPRHDYVAFLEIWEAVRRGGDPWSVSPRFGYSLNAYGPLFNGLAPLSWVNPLAPKLLFALAYLIHAITFIASGSDGRGPSRRAVGWMLGPFFWVEIAYFGHFDVLVALACVSAVRSQLRGRDVRAGLALAVGILWKYIPLTILPVLAAGGRRVRWRLAASAGLAVALGIVVSALVWGPSVFRPIGFATSRGSSLASIFRFLRGTYSPLRLLFEAPNLDPFNTPVLAVGVLVVFFLCRRLRARADTAAVATILTTLLLYRVGFLQYQVLVFLLLIDWLDRHEPSGRGRTLLTGAVDVYFGWLTVFNVVYACAGGVIHPGDPLEWLDETSGLVSFLLGLALLLALLNSARTGEETATAASGP